jgi:hypothetical protein
MFFIQFGRVRTEGSKRMARGGEVQLTEMDNLSFFWVYYATQSRKIGRTLTPTSNIRSRL